MFLSEWLLTRLSDDNIFSTSYPTSTLFKITNVKVNQFNKILMKCRYLTKQLPLEELLLKSNYCNSTVHTNQTKTNYA